MNILLFIVFVMILTLRHGGRSLASIANCEWKDVYGPYVNGEFQYPSNLSNFPVHSPSEQVQLCQVTSADVAYVDYAVNVAHQTFQSGVWSRSDVRARAVVLNKIAIKLRENIPRLSKMEVAQTGRAIRSFFSNHVLQLFICFL